jgi:hypothetical protein
MFGEILRRAVHLRVGGGHGNAEERENEGKTRDGLMHGKTTGGKPERNAERTHRADDEKIVSELSQVYQPLLKQTSA